jgi:hypothetical protein
MTTYDYNESSTCVPKLYYEIESNSNITTTLSEITHHPADTNPLHIEFEGTLSGSEETELDAIVSGHSSSSIFFEENFEVEDVQNSRTQSISFYSTDNGDGTYSGLARKITMLWTGNIKIGELHEWFYQDGTVRDSEKYDIYENKSSKRDKKIIRKKV